VLADEFAQLRPGPVMHHASAEDPEFRELAAAYRLLYSNERITPDPAPSIALCCQPAIVAGLRRGPSIQIRDLDPREDVITADGDIPAWLASAHRFVEQKEYEIRRTEKTNSLYTARSRQDLEGVVRGVDEIKLTLERLTAKGLL
jgi:hypothetical protein